MNDGSTVLVVGATGNQGRAVIDALRGSTDFSIRALTRSAAGPKAERLRDSGVDVVQGDVDDEASLRAAVNGVHGVFVALNFRDGGVATEAARGIRIADAARESGVAHLVYSSVGGAERNSGVPHFESKWRIEQHIQAIGLPHSTIRPVSFMTNLMEVSGAMRFVSLSIFRGMPADKVTQMVAVEDIGKWAALMFTKPEDFLGRAVEIAGDEVTFAGIVAAYRDVYGRTPRSAKLPAGLFGRGGAMGTMMTWMREQGYQADIAANRRAVPDMLTYRQFLALHRQM